jgi:RNA polymerase sigma factor (sigma-70 family)
MAEDLEILRRRLIAYVSHKLGRRDSEDIVQQAVVNCLQSAAFSEDKCNFGYLSTVCKNAVRRKVDRDDPELDGEQIPAIESVEDVVLADIDQGYIRYSIETLAELDQLILRKRYFLVMSFRSIAEDLEMNTNTVLTRHRRALDPLRPSLLDYFR